MRKSSPRVADLARMLKFIPNFLTICNSLCGFAAILLLVHAYLSTPAESIGIFVGASALIFFAMIFDVFDGFTARLLNAASLHGVQMDSLSDMVTFGVTPATMVAIFSQACCCWQADFLMRSGIYLLCCVYIGGAALRLALYNVQATLRPKHHSEGFSGLPSPGAAAAICVVMFFFKYHYSDQQEYPEFLAWAMPVYAAVLGLLMTSKFTYLHAGKWLMTVRRNRKRLLILVILLAVVAFFRIDGVAAITGLYLLSGPAVSLFRKIKPAEKITGER